MDGRVIAALYIFLAWRVRRGERLAAWVALAASTAVGWIVWFDLLGPVLLP